MIVAEELSGDENVEDEIRETNAPCEESKLGKQLTAKRKKVAVLNPEQPPSPIEEKLINEEESPKSVIIKDAADANFEARLLQAGNVFLRAKNDGKRVQLFMHTDRLYHPLKPVN